MPMTAEELVCSDYTILGNGNRMARSYVHPVLQNLESACHLGSLEDVQSILPLLTPLPAGILGIALVSLQKSVRAAVENKHGQVLRALLQGGFLPYDFCCLGVDAAFHAHDTDMLEIFIESGWNINEGGHPEMIMRPLLRHAVNNNNLRSFLLANGASPNIRNGRGLTPLETAAQLSPINVVKELLEHGGDPTQDDSLAAAAEAGRIDVVKLLVASGADVNGLEKELPLPWGQRKRRRVLKAARDGNHQDVIEWLEQNGATADNA